MHLDAETYEIDRLLRSISNSRWEGAENYIALSASLRTARVLTFVVDAELEKLGINWPRFETLMILRFSQGCALSLGKLSERLLVHPTSVTNTIDKLEAEGYVRRIPHSKDRRAILAQITDEGQELLNAAAMKLHQIKYGFAGSSNEQVVALIRSCFDFGFRTAQDDSIDSFNMDSMENVLSFLEEIFLGHSDGQVPDEPAQAPDAPASASRFQR